MKKTTIKEVRKVLFDYLKDYEGEPITLDFSNEILREILFDKNFSGDYFFANYNDETRELYKKIDYSNVCFDNFGEYYPGFSFEGFKGIKLNPQTMNSSLFKNVTFTDVEFIGPFDNIDITEANFTGSKGAVINVQKIARKSLYRTILKDVEIKGIFNGAIIREANFSGAKGDLRINPQTLHSKNHLIDLSYTIFDGVTFIGAFTNCLVEGVNFEGSKDAVINPQTIYEKNLTNTKLCGVTLLGRNILRSDLYQGVALTGTNFKGAKGDLKINPQTILRKELTFAKVDGVEFDGSFDEVEIRGTNFTNSKGAVINPQTIYHGFMQETKLNSVEIIGSFKEVNIEGTDFTGSIGAVIDPQTVYGKDMSLSILKDATVINEFFDVIIDNMNLEGAILVEPKEKIDTKEEDMQKEYCITKIKSAFKTK